jgi:hypothetical protein
MLKELLKAMSGTRTSVISPIDPPVLAQLRALSHAAFLNSLNTKAAISQHIFDFVRVMHIETFFQQGEKHIEALKESFKSTDRSRDLQDDCDYLMKKRSIIMRDYLIQKGYGLRDDITFDLRAGVLTEEVEV